MSPMHLLSRMQQRFAREDRGAAAVEFALILPILLLLYLGTLEASSLITVDRRISVISSTVGDLIARWDPETPTMTADDMTDYFRASEGIIMPYGTDGLLQVVSLIEVESDGSTSVVWSRGFNGATQRSAGSEYPDIPANLRTVAAGGSGFVVAAEASYGYTPVLGMVFTREFNLYSESFYLPRFGQEITEPSG